MFRYHFEMKPEPTNENQIRIAAGIDENAAIMAEVGREWDGNQIRNGMAVATQYEWTEADHEFFDRYLRWRSRQGQKVESCPLPFIWFQYSAGGAVEERRNGMSGVYLIAERISGGNCVTSKVALRSVISAGEYWIKNFFATLMLLRSARGFPGTTSAVLSSERVHS